MEPIKQAIASVSKDLFKVEVEPELSRPAEQFGDYATNVALKLAAQTKQKPLEVAEKLAAELKLKLKGQVAEVSIAGPGFINLRLSDDYLLNTALKPELEQTYKGQVVVTEYSDPNPFKVLHAGHLYTSVVGDAIANLFQAAGAKVYRVNFGGDVGLHVGKTMWAILQKLGGENPDKLKEVTESERAEWLTDAYIKGNNAYEDDPAARQAIIALNKQVYKIHADKDKTSKLAKIYWTCRTWSYDYFDAFYKVIGTHFDKYYPESETAPLGLETVEAQLKKGVFEKSDGAVIFKGEKYGLHTRVFINSEGLPTYEAKDVGLLMKKEADYHANKSVIITGSDIIEYMKVVLKAVEQFAPKLAQSTTHIPHGIVKLQGGTKMSSRKGNILRAVDVLRATAEANKKATGKDVHDTVLAAVKYAFIKPRIGADIIYDPAESVSILGNSGPYLQYAHARARSILAKAHAAKTEHHVPDSLQPGERSLVRKMSEFPEVVSLATNELLPHHIATYLYELAQTFNRFYENNRVIGDERAGLRLTLVKAYADILKTGLQLLNIPAPDSM